jgi:hypothetical protein
VQPQETHGHTPGRYIKREQLSGELSKPEKKDSRKEKNKTPPGMGGRGILEQPPFFPEDINNQERKEIGVIVIFSRPIIIDEPVKCRIIKGPEEKP